MRQYCLKRLLEIFVALHRVSIIIKKSWVQEKLGLRIYEFHVKMVRFSMDKFPEQSSLA